MRIGTNISAMSAQRYLTNNRNEQAKSSERLSSGARINRAADDAAGSAIADKMRADVRSLAQMSRNGTDAVSMAQVAEGSLNEISNILVRLRELSIQSASDTIGNLERSFADKEVQTLKKQIDVMAATTEFNGIKLLRGENRKLDFQLDLHKTAEKDLVQLDLSQLANHTLALGVDDVSVMTKKAAQTNLEKIDYALKELGENRSYIGAFQNRVQSAVSSFDTYRENLSAARSRIYDLDFAEETSNQVKNDLLTQSGIAMLAQATQNPKQVLKLLE